MKDRDDEGFCCGKVRPLTFDPELGEHAYHCEDCGSRWVQA